MAFVNLIDTVSELLFKHNCVIIPEFGGFIANYKHSGFEESRNLISPSSKKVAFNQSLLQNDGLLVNFWAQSQNKSYKDALEDVELFSSFLKDKIRSNKSFDFKSIGTFYLNAENKIIFVPYQGLNFLESSFGLHPVKIRQLHSYSLLYNSNQPTIEDIKAEETNEESIEIHPNLQTPSRYHLVPQFLRVASVLLFLAISIFSVFYLIDSNSKTQMVRVKQVENQASLLTIDTNIKKERKVKGLQLTVLEYQKERQKIKAIKTKLDSFSEYNSLKQETFNVVVGYYSSSKVAKNMHQKLLNDYSNAILMDKTTAGYGIVVESFFKHTTAETFCVMLKQLGFKNVKIEREIVIGK